MNRIAAINAIIPIQDQAVFSRKLKINGGAVGMTDFLYYNLCEPDVEHLSIGATKDVINMNVGDTVYIGHSTITRTK